jgi:hypothetical protein
MPGRTGLQEFFRTAVFSQKREDRHGRQLLNLAIVTIFDPGTRVKGVGRGWAASSRRKALAMVVRVGNPPSASFEDCACRCHPSLVTREGRFLNQAGRKATQISSSHAWVDTYRKVVNGSLFSTSSGAPKAHESVHLTMPHGVSCDFALPWPAGRSH